MVRLALLVLLFCAAAAADEIDEAKKRWAQSPHGPLLERILPPTYDARQLPSRGSRGPQLTVRYCVQCSNLPHPATHNAAKRPGIVVRMLLRMEGRGNLGTLIIGLRSPVQAPSDAE